jgi:hypothetical protein
MSELLTIFYDDQYNKTRSELIFFDIPPMKGDYFQFGNEKYLVSKRTFSQSGSVTIELLKIYE